jgi:hypothetical protein
MKSYASILFLLLSVGAYVATFDASDAKSLSLAVLAGLFAIAAATILAKTD